MPKQTTQKRTAFQEDDKILSGMASGMDLEKIKISDWILFGFIAVILQAIPFCLFSGRPLLFTSFHSTVFRCCFAFFYLFTFYSCLICLIYGCMVTITRICVFVPARLLPVSDGVPH
jgi:hypothetical protein